MTSILVGICQCTDLYHGELQGKELKIGDSTLVLEEQKIPEKGQWSSLSLLRPHFFLDVHTYNNRDGSTEYFVGLDVPDIFHTQRGSCIRLAYEDRYRHHRDWSTKIPPSSQEVIRAIQGIAETMGKYMKPERWEAWLRRQ